MDDLKQAVVNHAKDAFKNYTDSWGLLVGWHIVGEDSLSLLIRVDGRPEGAGPRYFEISVKEKL